MEKKGDEGGFTLKKRWFVKNQGETSKIEDSYNFQDKENVRSTLMDLLTLPRYLEPEPMDL